MKEVEVGLRIVSDIGISFFGIDEVNQMLSNGAKVTLIEPVGALTRQVQQEDGSFQLTISGFSLKVTLVVSE